MPAPPWSAKVGEGSGPPEEVTMTAGVRGGAPSSQSKAPVLALGGSTPYKPQGESKRRGPGGKWSLEQLRATDGIIPSQYGTNQFESQKGMTGFGTIRNTQTPITATNPNLVQEGEGDARHVGRWPIQALRASDGIIPSQYGTNQFASQRGMTGFGSPRDVKGTHAARIWDLMGIESCEQEMIVYNEQPVENGAQH